eukprot:TRINITY_DN72271_c0_g1_i1.p1 TRINITY_DN72271_c0_g1~~TRINITY_DN72271_c0_g1_i1.p1  ORF type:complete len:82 (-),score=2.53 TRINITY_DN72271_c0_g1_i1:253-498(-)
MGGVHVGDLILCILAIFLPPLPVLLKVGCTCQFCLNIILCLILWLPGILHAWWVICTYGQTVQYIEVIDDHHHHHHANRYH